MYLLHLQPILQVGVEDFSVLAFGSSAVLVKGPDTPWDAATQLALLEQYNCRKGGFAKPNSIVLFASSCCG